MKKYLLVFCLFLFFDKVSFAQNRAITTNAFGYEDLYQYMEIQRGNVATKIYELVEEKKITPYKNRLSDGLYTTEEFKDMGRKAYTVSIPNPNNPDNIYDLIDTVVYEYPDPRLAQAIEVDAMEMLILKIDSVNIAFFKIQQLKQLLYGEERAWVNFFIARNVVLQDRETLKRIAEKEFTNLATTWYELGLEGKIKAYRDIKLDEVITPEEIKSNSDVRQNIQHQNPNNPSDKYDLIDTVITTEFDPANIEKLAVYHEWEGNQKGGGVSVSRYAYAPFFSPINVGLVPPTTPMFFIRPDEAKFLFTPEENNFYAGFFTFLLRNRGNDYMNRETIYGEK